MVCTERERWTKIYEANPSLAASGLTLDAFLANPGCFINRLLMVNHFEVLARKNIGAVAGPAESTA